MNGLLRNALQSYTRTRLQRWLLLVMSLLFVAQLLSAGQASSFPRPFDFWPYLLRLLMASIAAMLAFTCAWEFRQILVLRTLLLIPHAKLKLAGGLIAAQFLGAAVGTGLVLPGGHLDPLRPLAWGTPRGTFELLFGYSLLLVVLVQVISGPSRVVSAMSVVLAATFGYRLEWFFKPQLLGVPTANVVALAGMLAWLLFAIWYVGTWHAAPPFSGWRRGVRNDGGEYGAQAEVSRTMALRAYLLGQPSLLRVCRDQIALWTLYHLLIVATLSGMKLMIVRHHFPADYSAAIFILSYAPVIGVNIIANSAARGSRRLWLRSGEPRAALYAIAARLSWKSLALTGLPLITLALVEARLLPHASNDMWFALAICVTLAPCALYFGLLEFQRRINFSFLLLYVIAIGAFFIGPLVQSRSGQQMLWLVPIALIAIACILRSIARRRWYGIDWLRFRAERARAVFVLRGE